MHEQWIIDEILSHLNLENVKTHIFTLMPDKVSLNTRLQSDIDKGIRDADIVEKSLEYLLKYEKINSIKIDVSTITQKQAAKYISEYI